MCQKYSHRICVKNIPIAYVSKIFPSHNPESASVTKTQKQKEQKASPITDILG